MMSSNFQLWYDAAVVGNIRHAFFDDGTWHGKFELSIANGETELQLRFCDFIAFSEEWNERVRRSGRTEAAEFDQYADLLKSGLWYTKSAAGEKSLIDEAPVFFAGGEVSWRTKEEKGARAT